MIRCALCEGLIAEEKVEALPGKRLPAVCLACSDADASRVTLVEEGVVWVVPESQYPERDWLTVKEAAAVMGIPAKTLFTWLSRGKMRKEERMGRIQRAGKEPKSPILIHRRVVEGRDEWRS